MAYLVHDLDTLIMMGQSDTRMESFQAAITRMEENGWPLAHVFQPPAGRKDETDPWFIFHKAAKESSGEVW